MKCRKCKEKLKEIPIGGFDAFSFIQSIKEMYCSNEKCEWFGIVVVAGITESKKTKFKKVK